MNLPIKILFLCTGNSCRSIIAESLANQLGAGHLVAYSAGSFPTGKVNDNAVAVLQKNNIDVGQPSSQSWDEYQDVDLDVVITVCAAAAGESCPIWLGNTEKAHWGVADPAHVTGSKEDIAKAFEQTYREMKQRIDALIALPLTLLNPAELTQALADIQKQFANTAEQ